MRFLRFAYCFVPIGPVKSDDQGDAYGTASAPFEPDYVFGPNDRCRPVTGLSLFPGHWLPPLVEREGDEPMAISFHRLLLPTPTMRFNLI
jgi:hypothetical protein